tara:strand:+ start:54395 stop:55363 length:969 start_codon:yes stop_codon:yes gene_type:complete
MKKITLFMAAGLFALAANAQNLSEVSVSSTVTPYTPDLAVLWDQPSIGGNGIISDISSVDGGQVFSADDFTLTESNRIDKISVFGFQNNGNLDQLLSGFDLYIYNNLTGFDVPDSDPTQSGTGVLELVNIDPMGGALNLVIDASNYAFEIDITAANGGDVVLPAGDYWLVVAPRLDITPVSTAAERWNWFDAGVPTAGNNEAHLIDPGDIFGAGATSWTSLSDLGVTFGSVAFVVEGEPALGVGENVSDLVSVYPNPASDILNVKVPSTVTVTGATLFDVLGNNTGVRLVNGQINIAGLANGVYLLNVETSAGTLTEKVIKK